MSAADPVADRTSGARGVAEDVTLRRIRLADIEGFADAVAEVVRERQYLATLEPFPLTESAAFVARNLEHGNPHWVAQHAGTIVGWCDIVRQGGVYRHCGVLGIGVVAEHRGAGLGTRLLRAALDDARALGFEHIELSVYAHNLRAHALYRSNGFVHEGTRRRGRKVDGAYDDVLMMGLLLQDGNDT